jgi:predicted amidohydrolase YtcJ
MAINNKEPAKYDIIIRNANIISMSDKRPQIEELIDLAIRDGKIIAIERNIIGHAEKIIDATDKFVIPGFINCHSHVAMGLFRETDRGVHLRE